VTGTRRWLDRGLRGRRREDSVAASGARARGRERVKEAAVGKPEERGSEREWRREVSRGRE